MQSCKILALLVSLGLTLTPQISVAQTLEDLEQKASAAEEVKKYEEAANIWRSLIKSDRNNSYAYVKLADVLSNQGKIAETIATYHQALQLTPDSAIYLKLANFLAEKGRTQEAIAAYRQAVKLDPGNDSNYVLLAKKLQEVGSIEEALVAYRQAVKLSPDSSNYYYLADTLFTIGKREEAIAAYREAIKLDENGYLWSENAYDKLGQILEYSQAVAIYRQISKDDPNNKLFYKKLAELSLERGFVNEAIAAYRHLTQIEPDASNYAELGDALVLQNKYQQAITAYRQAAAKEPKDYYYNKLSEALIKQGNLDEAVENCQKVIKIGEGSYETCFNISLPLHKEKGLAGVKAFYQQFTHDIPRRQIAEIYIRLSRQLAYDGGAKQEAMSVIQEALEIDPNNTEAQSALKDLLSN
ncbi:tetratricopeptide repeat protein [Nostoc sp. CENA67]|uniref:Tetratricopeptide repeat protein n=1 Tax=Amazonocrinis nigriterrae CENA67 TaxID=2794033 RepID=A0A8J7HTC5_9NOST|nr:tetratricopeptide repeat protein [Amazonocrinis nigriterrae]MBH8565162.1 tetratricopeptide repeat protein [Amazonocrinis nigriterrae CENA67]